MSINWDNQWASFAKNFYDGKAHIELAPYGGNGTLLLLPGPGFGDLSHPTTNLVLQLMPRWIQTRNVVDIGCGSGILGLAALKLGAKSSFGLDIDPEAIQHAQKNGALNQLDAKFGLVAPDRFERPSIVLMNMILPEQKSVMEKGFGKADVWITSGILATQRDEYLALTKEWGWRLEEEKQSGEWMGMVFRS